MTDQNLIKQLKALQKEMRKRYRKPCKEPYIDCFNCQAWIGISILENWQDALEWNVGSIKK
jgi:hypothetical protein